MGVLAAALQRKVYTIQIDPPQTYFLSSPLTWYDVPSHTQQAAALIPGDLRTAMQATAEHTVSDALTSTFQNHQQRATDAYKETILSEVKQLHYLLPLLCAMLWL